MALFVDEPLLASARASLLRSREAGDELHAPDLLLAECANTLWKRVARGELDRDSAITAIDALAGLGDLERHPLNGHLVASALSLAIAHTLTVYDAIYAALAIQLGGTVITGDKRFIEHATGAGLPVKAADAVHE